MRLFILAKPLDQAKQRLAPCLDRDQRRALAAAMLEDVMVRARAVRSVKRLSLLTSDASVADLARRCGIELLFEKAPSGLNAAAALARSVARDDGDRGLVILPADLPLLTPASLDAFVQAWRPGSVAAVRALDGGTNALVLDPKVDWLFAYGADSFARHAAVARLLGLKFQDVEDAALAFDVDRPADLTHLARTSGLLGRATAAFMKDLCSIEGGRRWA